MAFYKTILEQMGGLGKIKAMTGAYNFAYSDEKKNLSFMFKGSKKANCVRITLNAMDLYDVEFKKIWGMKMKDVETINDVYWDQLKSIFEETTGLYLSI
jgi:hypothetical protein